MARQSLEFLTTIQSLNAVMSALQLERTIMSNSKGVSLFQLPVQVAHMDWQSHFSMLFFDCL